ncbi:MAG: beta-galactosidase [Acidobacteria bacterium]|nr:beta-galactosidase [Acidobacteriota bacterium]
MKLGRRKFLESALSAPFAVALGRPGLDGLAALLPPAGQALFPNPQIIRYDRDCFTINGRDTFLVGGSFHYARCPQYLWRDRLLKFKRAGFNTLETYVFWNYHEPEEGHADMSELEAFINAVKDAGLYMIARVGPYACAEWDVGGFPHWVILKRFPLRSDDPESVKTSQHWYNLVLPVIQRHLITSGGPIILMQIENEYDFWRFVPDAQKRAYITALAQMAWNAGIDVPLITCWTKVARENSYPAMARIADFCNFYPRWNIQKDVPPSLQKLRAEEPSSPEGVTELQGGWFSKFGGQLSVDQEGLGPDQLNVLTKTVIEDGVTFYNYYMGFGGTNFDWAAKGLTTTYDYAAPVREPGGLWDKYYEARGIAQFVGMFGSVLTRAQKQDDAAQSTNQAVSVTERINGRSGVLFVRENANAEQRFKLSFVDPASPSHRIISVPRQGELSIAPRNMKMLPVQVRIAGGVLRYSTAEVLAQGMNLNRQFLILYDDPGHLVEFALATSGEPHVEGNTVYIYWDSEYDSVVVGARVEKSEQTLVINEELVVALVPRERALRTWVAEFPAKTVPETQGNVPISIPFISDGSLLAASGSSGSHAWADLDFRPGEHQVSALLPPMPTQCHVDGAGTRFQYDQAHRIARLTLATPELPYKSFDLQRVRTWIEKISDAQSGQWVTSALKPLEEFGLIPYDYVKYRFDHLKPNGQGKVFISAFADDGKKVFLNGKLVAEASTTGKQVEFELAKYSQSGDNTLEIAYELFGSPNGGANMSELKGIESVRLGENPQSATPLGPFEIQRFPAPMQGRKIDPEAPVGGWSEPVQIGTGGPKELAPAFTWCRAEFTMERPSAEWFAPWKVTFEADRDALLYLNGKFVGRYVTEGPQKDFYLPEPFFVYEGKNNVLTIVVAYAEEAGHIRTLRIGPYEEYATRRTRVEFAW